ncbi:hypothetical protein KKI24_29255, partial [bacterium]|nr:hypothetical protein [bacterium]
TASRGYLFRKTHESILGAPGIHPWLPRFSEQTTSFRLQVPTHIGCTRILLNIDESSLSMLFPALTGQQCQTAGSSG